MGSPSKHNCISPRPYHHETIMADYPARYEVVTHWFCVSLPCKLFGLEPPFPKHPPCRAAQQGNDNKTDMNPFNAKQHLCKDGGYGLWQPSWATTSCMHRKCRKCIEISYEVARE